MVKDSKQVVQIEIKDSTVPEIVSLIRHGERVGADFITDDFLRSIKGKTERETFKNLWTTLRKRIKYIADGEHQKIQSPGALWKSRKGDCKSFALFVACVMQKLCVPYSLILDRYNPDTPNLAHIFVIADGIIIDPVNPIFGVNDAYWKRKVYPGISCQNSVNGLKTNNDSSVLIAAIFFILIINKAK